MKPAIQLSGVIFIVALCLHLQARQIARADGGKQNGKGAAKGKKLLMPAVYLGHTDYKGGQISKDNFSACMKQGLTSRDSLGNKYKVLGFDFTYAERRLYENENADLVVLTDLASDYCHGDTLSSELSRSSENYAGIYDRIKPGDTVYFDHIKLVKYINTTACLPDSTAILGRGMQFVIVK